MHRALYPDSAISFPKLPEQGLYFSSGDGSRTLRSVAPLTSAITDLISATGCIRERLESEARLKGFYCFPLVERLYEVYFSSIYSEETATGLE